MKVKSYMVIEPTRFNRIHMNHLSPVYKFYHHQLKDSPNPTEAAELTRQFCFTYTLTKLEDQLAALEFLYMNDYFDDLKKVLEWSYLHEDAVLLYKVLLKRLDSPLSKSDFQELQQLTFTHPSLRCIHLFILVYIFYDMNQYAGMDKYTDDIQESLFMVNEPLFHYYMKLRFDELTFHHYWKTNSIVLAKKFAYKYIRAGLTPRKLITMNHHLGLCHTFEDYDLAMDYIGEALKLAKEYKIIPAIDSLINRTIPFLSAFHQRTNGIETRDLVERAHLEIVRGNNEKGISLLSSLEKLTPFQQSYLGLAKNDLSLLHLAKKRFIEENRDLFFAQLPDVYSQRIFTVM